MPDCLSEVRVRRLIPMTVAVLVLGCSKPAVDPVPGRDATVSDASGDAASSPEMGADAPDAVADAPAPTYALLPTQPATTRLGDRRGRAVVRGLIHAHSVHSHDACDGKPTLEDGSSNEPCLADFRRGICETRQDYVFLTEHIDLTADTNFDELSLVRPGDEPVRNAAGDIVANFVACENGHRALVIPGGEFDLMPVGLDGHVAGTPAERNAAYSEETPERVQSYKDLGAVVLQAHSEQRDRDTLRSLNLDGFEVYQLHANVDPNIRADFLGLEASGFLNAAVPFVQGGGGNPDLLFLTFVEPNVPSIAHFDALVSEGQHLTGTGGTDCHQNVLRMTMSDGERVDAYRRMMRWFSNHMLVDELSVDGTRDALRDGRLSIVFEVMGSPLGADFVAEAGAQSYEMGEVAPIGDTPALRLARPEVLDWGAVPVRLEILKIEPGGAVVVAEGTESLEYAVTEPGAYRAIVYITPEHLAVHLDEQRAPLAAQEYQWIWYNPIYVR